MAVSREEEARARKALAAEAAKLAEKNPYAMGTEAPTDLDGRMFIAARRAKTIGDALEAIIRMRGDLEPDDETIRDLGTMARELSWEIEAIHTVEIAESYRREAEGTAPDA